MFHLWKTTLVWKNSSSREEKWKDFGGTHVPLPNPILNNSILQNHNPRKEIVQDFEKDKNSSQPLPSIIVLPKRGEVL